MSNILHLLVLGIGDWGLGIGDWAQSPIPMIINNMNNESYINNINKIV